MHYWTFEFVLSDERYIDQLFKVAESDEEYEDKLRGEQCELK